LLVEGSAVVIARLPTLAGLATLLCALTPAALAADPSPRDQYQHALSELSHVPVFRMIETVDLRVGTRRIIQSEIRYRAPDRLETIITTLLPPTPVKFTQTQVSHVECQTAPHICFKTRRAPNAVAAVRRLLGPTVPVTYRAGTDAAGNRIVLLSRPTAKHSRYLAHLTIDAKTGLPLSFSSRVEQQGRSLVTQTANFTYRHTGSISLPPHH
jgi:hypothetical protein